MDAHIIEISILEGVCYVSAYGYVSNGTNDWTKRHQKKAKEPINKGLSGGHRRTVTLRARSSLRLGSSLVPRTGYRSGKAKNGGNVATTKNPICPTPLDDQKSHNAWRVSNLRTKQNCCIRKMKSFSAILPHYMALWIIIFSPYKPRY